MEGALIHRYAVDSSNLKSIGYEGRMLVIEFTTGDIYVYPDVPGALFEDFSRAESKGRFYNQQIKGKLKGSKITGICANCLAGPQIIGSICEACTIGTVREVVKGGDRYEDESRIKAALAGRDIVDEKGIE
ncbi:KTSC domain containing protein [uncultured Caudovirales phage]|uniref:KTSC domain containing protein n=1 Tax=uncultured Caudovirales phage TaxID=2100421 RepID=A0A6J5QY33_9CAUD|nr:KTSC domain containing protein [uncultured Caudovirales phage]CAB4200638.1 KTSC domain containing protein [uncultured Caudovirales phage]CAB4218672.1 KTSC domain containing protein [uncultured Caudovirales phage]